MSKLTRGERQESRDIPLGSRLYFSFEFRTDWSLRSKSKENLIEYLMNLHRLHKCIFGWLGLEVSEPQPLENDSCIIEKRAFQVMQNIFSQSKVQSTISSHLFDFDLDFSMILRTKDDLYLCYLCVASL